MITYDPFKILPEGYDVGPSTEEAYIFTGTEWPAYLDMSCNCLAKISGLDWIQFDATTRSLVISTSSNQYVGVYKIALVKVFANFVDVHPYTHFSLTVKPVVIAPVIKQPPFFENVLEPQTVAQCPGPKTELWSYELPKYTDPNNSPVTVSVQLENDFFIFDNSTLRITQKTVIEKSVNETIKVTLKNDLNLHSTYFLAIQFVCKVAPNSTFNYTMKEQKEKVAYNW